MKQADTMEKAVRALLRANQDIDGDYLDATRRQSAYAAARSALDRINRILTAEEVNSRDATPAPVWVCSCGTEWKSYGVCSNCGDATPDNLVANA